MKSKFIFLGLFLLIINIPTISQEGWYQQSSGNDEFLYSIFFIDSLTGWIVGGGEGTILHTINGGQDWTTQFTDSINYTLFQSVFFINKQRGWVGGAFGKIYNTFDSGNTWEYIEIDNAEGFRANSIFFVDSLNGWIAGESVYQNVPEIFYTSDGGEVWIPQYSDLWDDLNEIYFYDLDKGWAVGDWGVILRTANGGINWYKQDIGGANLETLFFTDSLNGWIGGMISGTLRTTDSGITWSYLPAPPFNRVFNSIHFEDKNTGWAVSQNSGTIYKTTDGANSWILQGELGFPHSLYYVFFTDLRNGWACGDYGTILHTTDGGGIISSVNIYSATRHLYIINQNYPNPFNPATTINYQIPALSCVTLKVYDVLGNEIAALVNEEKPAGEYEVEFDAKGLPSGIYFYQLKAGNYIETKKMVLMK